ncbi:MAG: cell division topological specificity factor MinE [Clostridiales bacterium]|nr:cell division topological specificity factor MinE [Clostridiales bacterium]
MKLMKLFHKKSSGDMARERLKILLVADRANCSPDIMEMIRTDMVHVISKYIEIDADALDIQITQTGTREDTRPILFANVPICSIRQYNRQTT